MMSAYSVGGISFYINNLPKNAAIKIVGIKKKGE
jgi:hypothetical protein